MGHQVRLPRGKSRPGARGTRKPRAHNPVPGRISTAEFQVFGERQRRKFDTGPYPMHDLPRKREQEFESLAENLPDIVMRFDRDKRHVYANVAVERLTGLRREAFIGKTYSEIPLLRVKAELFDRGMREVFETGRPNTIECSFDTRAGERFFEAHHIPEFGSNGEVLTALCVGHDITERKEQENRLLVLNHRLKQLVNAIHKLVRARDLEGVIGVVRSAARRLTDADGSTFVLREGNQCFYADEDAVSPLWKGQRFPMSTCISGWVMMNHQPAVIGDIYADPRIPAEAYRPTFVKSLVMVPIRSRDPLGVIGNYWAHPHARTREEVQLLQTLADATAITMERVQLYDEQAQRLAEITRAEERIRMFSQEILAAREEERKQVSSVLHHDVGSLAVGITAHLDAIEEDLRSGKPGEALKWMARTKKLFDESVVRLKGVAVQLRPPELDVLGLRAALRQHFSQITKHGGIRIHFRETLGRRRMSGNTATILFRVAQEALTNAITHGYATRVDVVLGASKKEVRLTVHDNGKGFDLSELKARKASQIGLRVMQEMTAFDGGAFTIDSGRGKGTTVHVSLPVGGR